jgi:hypothetical protein
VECLTVFFAFIGRAALLRRFTALPLFLLNILDPETPVGIGRFFAMFLV